MGRELQMLAVADERDLTARLQGGNRAAEAQLVAAFDPLAKNMAHAFLSAGLGAVALDFEDLLQAAREGIIHAARDFDLTRSNRFSTYAIPRIRAALQQAAVAAEPFPRPVNDWCLERKVVAVSERLADDTTDTPSLAAVARQAELPESRVRDTLQHRLSSTSADALPIDQQSEALDPYLSVRPRQLVGDAAMRLFRQLGRIPRPDELATFVHLGLDVLCGGLLDDPDDGREIRCALLSRT